MTTQSNSTIFSTSLFGTGTNDTASNIASKNLLTQEEYLSTSGIANLGTQVPKIPSNQRVAKD